MPNLFSDCLNAIVYDSRPGKARSVERMHEESGISKHTLYKWMQDEGTHAINEADRLSRMLDDDGDPRLIQSRMGAKSTLIHVLPTLVDGCCQKEKDGVIAGLSGATSAWSGDPRTGIEACQAGIAAFTQWMEEFKRLL